MTMALAVITGALCFGVGAFFVFDDFRRKNFVFTAFVAVAGLSFALFGFPQN